MSRLNLTGRVGMGFFNHNGEYTDDVTYMINEIAPKLAKELEVSVDHVIADRVSFQDILAKKERIFEKYGLKSYVLNYTYDLMKNCIFMGGEYSSEERKEFVRWYEAHEENC